MKALAFAVAAALFTTGCGFSGGFLRDSTTQHNLNYDMKAGFKHIGVVSGESSRGSVLCLIPLGESPYAEAMTALHMSAKLQPNQMVLNLREDVTTRAYLFFYCTSALTISADVVEFTKVSAAAPEAQPTPRAAPVAAAPVVPAPKPAPAEPDSAPPPSVAPQEKDKKEQGSFDLEVATAAIVEAIAGLSKACPDAVGKRGTVSLMLQPDGRVSRVIVDPPVAGTSAGLCISTQLRSAVAIPPFAGKAVTVKRIFAVK